MARIARILNRADGRQVVVDANTGAPLGLLEADEQRHPPVSFPQRAMIAAIAFIVLGLVALVAFNAGRLHP